MSLRNVPRTIPEQIKDLDSRLRAVQGSVSRTPAPQAIAPVTFDDPVPSVLGEGTAEGVSSDVARADHGHSRRSDIAYVWGQVGL